MGNLYRLSSDHVVARDSAFKLAGGRRHLNHQVAPILICQNLVQDIFGSQDTAAPSEVSAITGDLAQVRFLGQP